MLPIDLIKPTTWVLGRLSDGRARQFWDPQHLLAAKIAEVESKPGCCERDGLLWDVAAVYPPGAVWTKTLPAASVFDGPVVSAERRVESASLR